MTQTKTSKYIGVSKERNRWRADIKINGKGKFLGYHSDEVSAARAYDTAVITYKLNRPTNKVVQQPTLAQPTMPTSKMKNTIKNIMAEIEKLLHKKLGN